MVHGEIEEALDLPRVQVHRDDPLRAGHRQQVGHELRGDRLPGQGLLVLARISVVGDDRGDALGRSPLQGVQHDELLHEGLVDWVGVGLDEEHVGPPHTLVRAEVDVLVQLALSRGRLWASGRLAGAAQLLHLARAAVRTGDEHGHICAGGNSVLSVAIGYRHGANRSTILPRR